MTRSAYLLALIPLFLSQSTGADVIPKLDGYNYVITWDKGQIADVHVSGENGSGLDAPLFAYDEEVPAPKTLRHLPKGSVLAVRLPVDRLLRMSNGEKVTLNLPGAAVTFVHDNRFNHDNGDVTWVAHTEEGKEFRAFLTLAQGGAVLGQIDTGSGQYLLHYVDGRSYLVDLNKSRLKLGSMANDAPVSTAGDSVNAWQPSSKSGRVTIDLLVLHGQKLANASTRINQLLAMTNQTYIDSRIGLVMRLVGSRAVGYTSRNNNATALNDLTASTAGLANVRSLREKYHADLVTLVRPFYKTDQAGCGIAWINGVQGSVPQARFGFSVVSDGLDQLGAPYYCSSYALAHELGHNLGSAHDVAHSASPGAFSFSYGYQLPKSLYGTVMSYFNPRIGYFSNPRIKCFGEACGVKNSADNARSIGLIAPYVASFR